MPQRAHVTSAEAIETFRSNLIVYVSKARPALEEVSADVMRMRSWLENDARAYWEREVRKRTKELEQAQQELFSARLSNISTETASQQFAYHRARRALDEAIDKMRILKRWTRDFDTRVQPLVKQMEKLHTVLSHDIVLAIAHLTEVAKTLAAYAEVAPPSSFSDAPQSSPQPAAEEAPSPPQPPANPQP